MKKLFILAIGISLGATAVASPFSYTCGGYGGGEKVVGTVTISANAMKTTFSDSLGRRVSNANSSWAKYGPFLTGEKEQYYIVASSGMISGAPKGGIVFLFANKSENTSFGCKLN